MFKRGLDVDAFAKAIAVCGSVLLLLLFVASSADTIAFPMSDTAQRLVSLEDTLAQWLMAVFSLFALMVSAVTVYWVRETLIATRQMAEDTRLIGEAQVRSYIYANKAEIDVLTNTIAVLFRNFGNSPGSISFVDCFVWVGDMYENKEIWSQRFWSDGWTIAPQDTFRQEFRLDAGRADFLKRMIDRAGVSVVIQGTFQSVDVFRRVHAHGINIVLSDGIIRT